MIVEFSEWGNLRPVLFDAPGRSWRGPCAVNSSRQPLRAVCVEPLSVEETDAATPHGRRRLPARNAGLSPETRPLASYRLCFPFRTAPPLRAQSCQAARGRQPTAANTAQITTSISLALHKPNRYRCILIRPGFNTINGNQDHEFLRYASPVSA